MTLEEQEGAINFKFGIIYAKTGQTTDDEMFSNSKLTHAHQIWWAWPLQCQRHCYFSNLAKFPFQTMDYSPWGSKDRIGSKNSCDLQLPSFPPFFPLGSGSPAFMQFIDLLGDTVDLFGWAHYKGGLDTRNNATGLQSVYTVFGGHEVMFHVSTMLPYSEENKQQVGERKMMMMMPERERDGREYER